MTQTSRGSVRSDVTGVAVVSVTMRRRVRPGTLESGGAEPSLPKFREIWDTPRAGSCRANRRRPGWMSSMGRKSKGDRHTIIPSMPLEAGMQVKAEAAKLGFKPLLEISSKSPDGTGVALSAFNLLFKMNHRTMSVESAFQGSKVFEQGGPFHELYDLPGYEAKKDARLKSSGKLVAFNFDGLKFPTKPVTAFYDWLYLSALAQNPTLAEALLSYAGFTDIAFNPERSLNCQARSAALFVALSRMGKLPLVPGDVESYLRLVRG